MRKKVLVGVLLGAMVLSMVGCKDKGNGETKNPTSKPAQTEKEVTPEATIAPEKELDEYENSVFGFTFMMPRYSNREKIGAWYAQKDMVENSLGSSVTEKYVAVGYFSKYTTLDGVDIQKVNSVYDIHENMGQVAYDYMLNATRFTNLLSYDVTVAEEAEMINGYEALSFEGTMVVESAVQNYTFGITGYYIFANGLPIIVQGVDCSASVEGGEYSSELSLMDSIREDVDAMVRTFNGDNMHDLGMIR